MTGTLKSVLIVIKLYIDNLPLVVNVQKLMKIYMMKNYMSNVDKLKFIMKRNPLNGNG